MVFGLLMLQIASTAAYSAGAAQIPPLRTLDQLRASGHDEERLPIIEIWRGAVGRLPRAEPLRIRIPTANNAVPSSTNCDGSGVINPFGADQLPGVQFQAWTPQSL